MAATIEIKKAKVQIQVTPQPRPASVMTGAFRPPDYKVMVAATFACLFCSCPTGLVAIYYAVQANDAVACDDLERAQEMSTKAQDFVFYSILLGIYVLCLVIVLHF